MDENITSKQYLLPGTNLPRVIIIGGGFGGLELAGRLKNKEIQVVFIDKNNYHTFQPLLYQVATGGLEPASIAYPLRRFFRKYNNLIFRMTEVKKVNPQYNEIETPIGKITYDYLVIATGSKTNFFGLTSVEANAARMKSIPKALDLRSIILQNFEEALLLNDIEERDRQMNIVIAGGGPTGVETAGALGELKRYVLPRDYPELDIRRMEIHLIEASSRLIGGMSEEASEKALEFLKELDVNVWTNTIVTNFDSMQVTFKDGKFIKTKTLIWTAGVIGATLQGIPASIISKGNRIKVDEINRVEGLDNIFAIGDVAAMISEKYPVGHPMLAPVAMQQGKLLGDNILRLIKKKDPKPFKYRDKGTMATIGRNRAVADLGKIKFQGTFAWFIWMFVHLMSLVGFRNKLVVLLDWFWNYITYDRSLRLIIRPFKRKQKNVSATAESASV